MASQRDSINKAAIALCDLINEGGLITESHRRLADRLRGLAGRGGTYQKQYRDHAERVLHRHLNLYKNKLSKAATDVERAHWQGKIAVQEAKLKAHYRGVSQSGTDGLDLDGL